jgi:hypothetical protein
MGRFGSGETSNRTPWFVVVVLLMGTQIPGFWNNPSAGLGTWASHRAIQMTQVLADRRLAEGDLAGSTEATLVALDGGRTLSMDDLSVRVATGLLAMEAALPTASALMDRDPCLFKKPFEEPAPLAAYRLGDLRETWGWGWGYIAEMPRMWVSELFHAAQAVVIGDSFDSDLRVQHGRVTVGVRALELRRAAASCPSL